MVFSELFIKNKIQLCYFYPENFCLKIIGDKLIIRFDLGVGNYATMVLRMIFSKVEKLD